MRDRIVAWWRRRGHGWSIYPTRRLGMLVAVVALLWLLPGDVGALVAPVALGGVVLGAIVDALRLPVRDDITVDRAVPERMGLGDHYEISYEIASAAPRAVSARFYDAIPNGVTANVERGSFALEPGRTMELRVDAVGERRGRHRFGPAALRLETSLGLMARLVSLEIFAETTVVPSLSNVRRLRLLAMQNRASDAGVRALRQRGEGTAFAGLRDYVPGDDPRLVDWKASARHGQLTVREQTIERSQAVDLMVDCGRAMTQLAGRYSRFEQVLSAALVVCDVAAASGDRVGLLAFDDEVRAYVPPLKGLSALRGLRASLSGLDASLTEPDYASAFRVLAARQRRRALLILFTDVVDSRAAQSFLAQAKRAAQRHLFVVDAIQNEALVAAARPTSAGSAALYRSAAAEELIREREEALARLRAAGLTVIDIDAARMAASVVNRYLEIKARGLL
jgi:uncharacterized protein (DUF58 family)